MGDWIAELVAQGQAENEVETEVQVKKAQSAEDSELESSSAGVKDPNKRRRRIFFRRSGKC